MTTTDAGPTVGPSRLPDGREVRKGLALLVLAMSQLMIVLDVSVVNVALPDIAKELHVASANDLSWVVTGYTLTFGGFLLLGGKLADRLGRRRVFVAGALLFAVASLLGGLAGSLGLLIGARLLQGLGGALMAPSALSMLTVVFAEGRERNRALGVWAAISAGGAAIGLILGGVLTEYASWRWVLFINVPVAILAVLGALRILPESRDARARGFDVPGAVLATGGLIALVYALVKGNDYGWTSARTLLMLGLAVVLLAAFVVVQRRTRDPLVDFRLFRSRSLLGADLGALFVGAGLFAVFFFLVLWMQQVHGYSPLRAGFAILPMTGFIVVGAAISSQLLARIGARPLLIVGPTLGAAGMLALALRLQPDSSYASVILPALCLLALGMGMTFVALTSSAVAGVPQEDAGVASALLNSGQQIGGSLGLAILTAVSTARTDAIAAGPPGTPAFVDALVSGWALGFVVAAGFLAMAGIVSGSLVRLPRTGPVAEPEPVPAV
ncbi:DHA2 family efflux MFS transporter permease subunit [Petropleomorpha daqingensis]|uniref:EmrB/QacA subfamily drug resistance transporter n=1 Tax=Petropleomorpha daqingensis TaxID=2026353 RepID=A0A853CPZ9_9ACTN|nr:EmrB/QacA subfamily drug resistance transporter [Petropleomorpha daqingensis]